MINTNNWKEFFLKDIFRFEATKGKDSTLLVDGNDISYIGAKKNDNGFVKECKLNGFEDWVSQGNCIVFINLGAGSAGYTTYQKDDFIGMNGKTTCGYNENLNEENALFIETILDKERSKYSFGRSWTGDRLKNTLIKLPVDSQGLPNWEWMSEYIKKMGSTPVTTKVKNVKPTELDISNWGYFKVKDIFETLKRGKCHSSDDLELGNDLWYIGAKKNDNGLMKHCKIDYDYLFKGNSLVFICNGEGSVGYTLYQDDDFIPSADIICGYSKNLNKYIGMFLVSVLDKERPKYSFGRKWGKYVEETEIKLPVKSKGIPDWNFMESYIKKLYYSDRI